MKGLIFSEPMVTAWLEGRKTVTRRLMKPQTVQPTLEGWKMNPCLLETGEWGWYLDGEIAGPFIKPPYRPGETVYIKETWRIASVNHSMSDGHFFTVQFKDFHVLPHPQPDQSLFGGLLLNDNLIIGETGIAFGRWRSPRFMPEWAARSHALIKSVRPERIREITEREAVKEGFCPSTIPMAMGYDGPYETASIDHSCYKFPSELFLETWVSLYPGSWDHNDWVWRFGLEKQ